MNRCHSSILHLLFLGSQCIYVNTKVLTVKQAVIISGNKRHHDDHLFQYVVNKLNFFMLDYEFALYKPEHCSFMLSFSSGGVRISLPDGSYNPYFQPYTNHFI